MAERDTMRELSNTACIVGVAESDEMGVLPHKSQMALHLEAITNAVSDAGLKVGDVDGIFTAGAHSPAPQRLEPLRQSGRVGIDQPERRRDR